MSDVRQKLLELAQSRMQIGGYFGFSFRDLAAAIGIKDSSVHHHFPTKAHMAAAVGQRYIDRFFEIVAPQPGETADIVIARYRQVFRDGILDNKMCLFGMLGTEFNGVPDAVRAETAEFFRRCVSDLEQRIGGGPDARRRARQVMATLEGAQILVRASGDISAFDDATAHLATATPDKPGS